ncbi:hypothetical protein Fsol_00210 [Candidatus Fokinia solitaria]|uniref:Uncharacterized protein n=1 Tax=Candidatus Fokinia solitaria TaxID=1802984 RepID=A0A2U8BRN9_9RICK|nr:hypothetical protein [Candidatus Fokinia solitaria]AWD33014.1 hypothetical protein Fsol_00210 [Candidatus Fokinia solitaria]
MRRTFAYHIWILVKSIAIALLLMVLFTSLLTLLHIRLTQHQKLLIQSIVTKYTKLPHDKELILQNVDLRFKNLPFSVEVQCAAFIADKATSHFQYTLPNTKVSLSLLPWSFFKIDSISMSDCKLDKETLPILSQYIQTTDSKYSNFKILSKSLELMPQKIELQNITLQYETNKQVFLEKFILSIKKSNQKYDIESVGTVINNAQQYVAKLNALIEPQLNNSKYVSSAINVTLAKYALSKEHTPLETEYKISINQNALHLFEISFNFHDAYIKNILSHNSQTLDIITGHGYFDVQNKTLNINNGNISTDNGVTAKFNLQYQHKIPQLNCSIKNTSPISRNDFFTYWPQKFGKNTKKFIQENVFFDSIVEGSELTLLYAEDEVKHFSWKANTLNSKFAPLSLQFPVIFGKNVAVSGEFSNKETNVHLDAKNAYADFSKILEKHKLPKSNPLYISSGQADITFGTDNNFADITYYTEGKIISYLDVIKTFFTQKSVERIIDIIDDNFDVQNTRGTFLMNLKFDLFKKDNNPVFKINGHANNVSLKETSYTHQIRQLLGLNVKFDNVLLSWHENVIQAYGEFRNAKDVHQAFLNYEINAKKIRKNNNIGFSEYKEKVQALAKKKDLAVKQMPLTKSNGMNEIVVLSSIYSPVYFEDVKIVPRNKLNTLIALSIDDQIALKSASIKCQYASIYRSNNPVNIANVSIVTHNLNGIYKFLVNSSAISYDGTIAIEDKDDEKIFVITPAYATSKEEKTIIKKSKDNISIDVKQNTLNLSGLTITDLLNLRSSKKDNRTMSVLLDIENILLGERIELYNTMLRYIRGNNDKDTKFTCLTNSTGNTGRYEIAYANDKLSIRLQNVTSLVKKVPSLKQFKKGNVILDVNFKTIGQSQYIDENVLQVSNLDIHNNKLINTALRVLSLYPSMINIVKIITMQQQIGIQNSKCYITALNANEISLIGCNIESDMFTIIGEGNANIQRNEIEFKGKMMLKTFIDILLLPITTVIHRKDYRPKFTFNFRDKIF